MDLKQEAINPLEVQFNYKAVLIEVFGGNFETFLKWKDKIPETVILHFYEMSFHCAVNSGQKELYRYLLRNPFSFRYLEKNYSDDESFGIHPFVDETILEFKQQKLLFENTDPGISFDLEQKDEIHLCYYLARNLIRRKDNARKDDLLFLLNIPSVKALIQTEVTPDRPNELMHLAITINNSFAEEILFQICSTRFVDEENDFHTLRKDNENTFFDFILQLAKENNRTELERLCAKEPDYYEDSLQADLCPARWLARQGEQAAVELLTEVFHLDLDNLVMAYAWGGHVNQVDHLLSMGASFNYAAFGYAAGGYFDKVNPNAIRYYILEGSALGGHFQKTRELLSQNVNPEAATHGFARGGYFREVNQQIAAGANRKDALAGYWHGGYLHPDNILRLMAVTDDDELRRLLAESIKEIYEEIDIEHLYQQATRLNRKFFPKGGSWDSCTLFDRVYQYSVEGNEKALAQMVKDGICLGTYQGNENPLIQLAKDGQHQAVHLLINKFHGNVQHAIRGYAEGGFTEKVKLMLFEEEQGLDNALAGYITGGFFEEAGKLLARDEKNEYKSTALVNYAKKGQVKAVNKLIKDNNDRSDAVYGYILGNYLSEAQKLLQEGAKPGYAVEAYAFLGKTTEVNALITPETENDALIGFARAGNVKEVNALIAQGNGGERNLALILYCQRGFVKLVDQQIAAGSHPDKAVNKYASSGYFQQVNQLIAVGVNLSEIVKGYASGGFITGKIMPLLRLLVFTDNLELRSLLAEGAKKKNQAIEPQVLLTKARKINALMLTWSLDFRGAYFWIEKTPGELIWILQGCQLVENNTILPELFWIITQFTFNLPPYTTIQTVSAISKHVLPERAQPGFFSLKPQEGSVCEESLARDIIENFASCL